MEQLGDFKEEGKGRFPYRIDSNEERATDPEAAKTDEERIEEVKARIKEVEEKIDALRSEAEAERRKMQNLGELGVAFENENGVPERDVARRTEQELTKAYNNLNNVNERKSAEWKRFEELNFELKQLEAFHAMIKEDLLNLEAHRNN